MSILLYRYKELTQCISEVEWIDAKVNSSKKRRALTKEEEQEVTNTLDSYFVKNAESQDSN